MEIGSSSASIRAKRMAPPSCPIYDETQIILCMFISA
jgi:hypothetical protein